MVCREILQRPSKWVMKQPSTVTQVFGWSIRVMEADLSRAQSCDGGMKTGKAGLVDYDSATQRLPDGGSNPPQPGQASGGAIPQGEPRQWGHTATVAPIFKIMITAQRNDYSPLQTDSDRIWHGYGARVRNLGAAVLMAAIQDYRGRDRDAHESAAQFLYPKTEQQQEHFEWAVRMTDDLNPAWFREILDRERQVWDALRLPFKPGPMDSWRARQKMRRVM